MMIGWCCKDPFCVEVPAILKYSRLLVFSLIHCGSWFGSKMRSLFGLDPSCFWSYSKRCVLLLKLKPSKFGAQSCLNHIWFVFVDLFWLLNLNHPVFWGSWRREFGYDQSMFSQLFGPSLGKPWSWTLVEFPVQGRRRLGLWKPGLFWMWIAMKRWWNQSKVESCWEDWTDIWRPNIMCSSTSPFPILFQFEPIKHVGC